MMPAIGMIADFSIDLTGPFPLRIVERGAQAAFIEALRGAGSRYPKMRALQKEALEYALIGDFDEAEHRLRLAYAPKFENPSQGRRAYLKAMGRPVRKVKWTKLL